MVMGKHQQLLIISIAFVLLQFACVSTASTVNTSAVTDEWSMFRHDPSHSAYTTDARLADSVRVLWTFKTWKGVMSSPAVAYGCLLVGSGIGVFTVLTSPTGNKYGTTQPGMK